MARRPVVNKTQVHTAGSDGNHSFASDVFIVLGGGFKFFEFHPEPWGDDPI